MIPIYLHCIPIVKALKKAVLKMFGSSVIYISLFMGFGFFCVLVNNIVNKLFVVINAYNVLSL